MAMSAFDDRDIADLDDEARAAFVARAIPPRVADHRCRRAARRPTTRGTRHDDLLRVLTRGAAGWVTGGDLPEVAAIADVSYVDIDSGHWPQLTRPEELAALISDAASAA